MPVKQVFRNAETHRPRLQPQPLTRLQPQPAVSRYRLSDDQWSKLQPIIDTYDPTVRRSGRRRIDPRGALDAIIYQTLTGCSWNKLLAVFPNDSSVHRTYQRWKRLGVLKRLWATLLEEEVPRDGGAR